MYFKKTYDSVRGFPGISTFMMRKGKVSEPLFLLPIKRQVLAPKDHFWGAWEVKNEEIQRMDEYY